MPNERYHAMTVDSILNYDSKSGRAHENRVKLTVRKIAVRSPTLRLLFDNKYYGLYRKSEFYRWISQWWPSGFHLDARPGWLWPSVGRFPLWRAEAHYIISIGPCRIKTFDNQLIQEHGHARDWYVGARDWHRSQDVWIDGKTKHGTQHFKLRLPSLKALLGHVVLVL